MKDLEELGRLKDLGLLTDEEFETARQEIFSQRPNATDPAHDGDADPEEPEGADPEEPEGADPEEPERSVEEGEVASPSDPDTVTDSASLSDLDIVTVDDETTTDSADNWWQASDGQWYPPEALDALKEQGWFQGDDGQWYPPPQPVIEEPSPAPPDQPTEASSEQAPASAEPAAEASAITQARTEGTPEPDEPESPPRVRRVSADPLVPVPPALRSSETSTDGWKETTLAPRLADGRGPSQNAASTSKNLPNRRTLVAAAVLVVLVVAGIMAVLPRSETTLPTAMEPVRAAVLSSTFGQWEDAQSAFVPYSPGANKWQALTARYRAYFERGNFSEKSQMGVSLQDDWYVIEYCTVEECDDGSNVFEIHLKMSDDHGSNPDRVNDLRWFRGTKDSTEEVVFYEVRLDPDYLWDDPSNAAEVENVWPRPGLDFDYAMQDKEIGCLIGKAITPDLFKPDTSNTDVFDSNLMRYWRVNFYLDGVLRTDSGLELESSGNTHPRTMEVREMGEDPLVFCTEYEISDVSEFVIPESEWSLAREDGDSRYYIDDFVVPFELVRL